MPFLGESFNVMRDPAFPDAWGAVQAIDLNTGKQAWNFPSALPWNDGMLATAGGLVFSGSADGYLYWLRCQDWRCEVEEPADELRHHRRAQHMEGR